MKLFLILFASLVSTLFSQELKPNPPEGTFDKAHRFVFFAVLEGCFETGLTQDEIDLIIPVRPEKKDRRSITANLVYTCPLCSPAFDAFRIYSDRRIFISKLSKEAIYNTFGSGLDPAQKKALKAGGAETREVIQQLISTWIERRIKMQRLEPKAEKELRTKLAEMRKEGEAILKKIKAGEMGPELQKVYQEREGCPVCAGASPMAGGKE